MTDETTSALRQEGPQQELIDRLTRAAQLHHPEDLDHEEQPEYTWREIREISDLLAEAAAALSASRTAQEGQQEKE